MVGSRRQGRRYFIRQRNTGVSKRFGHGSFCLSWWQQSDSELRGAAPIACTACT